MIQATRNRLVEGSELDITVLVINDDDDSLQHKFVGDIKIL